MYSNKFFRFFQILRFLFQYYNVSTDILWSENFEILQEFKTCEYGRSFSEFQIATSIKSFFLIVHFASNQIDLRVFKEFNDKLNIKNFIGKTISGQKNPLFEDRPQSPNGIDESIKKTFIILLRKEGKFIHFNLLLNKIKFIKFRIQYQLYHS
jgi:hypothetical protein